MSDATAGDKGKTTGQVPSGTSITVMMLVWLASCVATFWMAWGAETTREFVGTGLGFLLAFLLLGQWLGRVARRGAAVLEARERALEQAAGEPLVQYKPGPY